MPLKLRKLGDKDAKSSSPSKQQEIKHESSPTSTNQWENIKKALTPATSTSDPSSASNAPAIPLIDPNNIVNCPDCDKPVLESALEFHKSNCAEIRRRANMKRSAEDSSATSPSKKPKSSSGFVIVLGGQQPAAGSNGSTSDEGNAKASGSGSGSGSGTKKKASFVLNGAQGAQAAANANAAAGKAKLARTNGQVDVDKQCGVINDKNLPCSRSLTCKSHSMGAKRSVPHRSRPYDVLLHEWQKVNKPGFKGDKPVQGRVGPGLDGEFDESLGGGKKKKKNKPGHGEGGKKEKNRDGSGTNKKNGITIVGEYLDESDSGEALGGNLDEALLIDSDEEVEGVFKALGRVGRGRPLNMVSGGGAGFSAASMFVGRNSKLAKLGDVLGGVFSFTPPA